ncbi:class I adenylate-forming enzyme family protein [Paenibacillus pinisoli]|uniref:class I adenylate-forming enzyme family protein n=1 Tax=Paenibacillus pinisoli TaxID=1276110 RepID=UPI001403C55E|nr:class I adenylate-forming enzyme family protein [Paenibacillus pinisoli]
MSEWLESGARLWPEKVAVNTRQYQVTYSQLFNYVQAFCNSCRSNGMHRGDRVILYLSNTLEAVIAIFGVIRAGGMIVCISPRTPVPKLKQILSDSGAQIIVADHYIEDDLQIKIKLAVHINNNVTEQQRSWTSLWDWVRIENINAPLNEGEHLALIYTSGSTGSPKGIISTRNNILFSTKAINQFLMHGYDDRVLSYLPLSFDYGLYQLFLTISSGATLYLRDSRKFAVEISTLLRTEQITGLPGLRSLFAYFLLSKKETFESIRYVTNTGDALPPNLVQQLQSTFPQSKVYLMYGLSECKRVSILPPADLQRKPNSVGLPLRGTSVRIVDDLGQLCAPFVEGELVVEGQHICAGYWGREEETKDTFLTTDNGVRLLKTGDICYLDDEGYLYYVGRRDKMFKSKGYRIDPLEIENSVTDNFTEVADAIAIGVPNPRDGMKIILFARTSPHVDKEHLMQSIIESCQLLLEPWKQPEEVFIMEKFPLTTSGKIDRRLLTENYIKERGNESVRSGTANN